MELKEKDIEDLAFIIREIFKNDIRSFIEKKYRSRESMKEIEDDLNYESLRIELLLGYLNFSRIRIKTLIGFFNYKFYYELYKFEEFKKNDFSRLESYYSKIFSNYLDALKFGGYEISDELKQEILESARKKQYFDALDELIDEIYGQSTICQKFMYAIYGTYYDKNEALAQFQLFLGKQSNPQPNPEQKQK